LICNPQHISAFGLYPPIFSWFMCLSVVKKQLYKIYGVQVQHSCL
jgi:hypothetical protein